MPLTRVHQNEVLLHPQWQQIENLQSGKCFTLTLAVTGSSEAVCNVDDGYYAEPIKISNRDLLSVVDREVARIEEQLAVYQKFLEIARK